MTLDECDSWCYIIFVDIEKVFSIGELAAESGVSRRTVRFYVQRGLVPPPVGLGRGATYTQEHLRILLQVKALQESGASLEAILFQRAGGGEMPACPSEYPRSRPAAQVPARAYLRQEVMPAYELHIRAGAQPLTARQLHSLAAHLRSLLEEKDDERTE